MRTGDFMPNYKNKSKSQYSGTLKNSVCSICKKNLNNLKAEEQELHLTECKKQNRIDSFL